MPRTDIQDTDPVSMIIHLFLFLLSLTLVILLTPFTIRLAEGIGAVDIPTERKVHKAPIPRLGGVAVILAVGISLLLGAATDIYLGRVFQVNLVGSY